MGDYDSKAIEDRAATEVIRYFEVSNIVGAYINLGDKEPFFDGHLYLYRGGLRDNDHCIGRVAAQVKGKDLGCFNKGVFSYPIEMTALKAYLHEGVAYFVVQEVKRKKKLYYKLLTPLEIRSLIQKKKGQDTVSVRLEHITDRDIHQVEAVLVQFDRDCKKQISFVDTEPFDFEDIEKNGVHSFSVDITVKDKKEPFYVAVTKNPVYLYANINEKVQVPLGFGRTSISLMREVKQPVIVGGKEYYDVFETKIENGLLTINVGECLAITFDPSLKKHQVSLNISRKAKMLKDVIREAEFLLALQKHKEITIGTLSLPIPFPDKHELTDELDTYLEGWHELEHVLRDIHCNKDLDLSQIDDKGDVFVNILIDMLGHGNERKLKGVEAGVNNFKFGNLNLWLVIFKKESGKYIMKNFFDPSIGLSISYQYPEGKLNETIYSWLNREKLLTCDNVPYDEVIPSYEKLRAENSHVYERCNTFLLEVIAAYDEEKDEIKRQTMYDAAITMNQWLLENDTKVNKVLHKLNRYQILKRRPGLTEADKDELKKIGLENHDDEHVVYGVALLLDDKSTYDYYWGEMEPETQKLYRERMPIYKFHK